MRYHCENVALETDLTIIVTVVVSTGGTDHEDFPHEKRMHGVHEDRHPTNTSGIISSSESKHETDLKTSPTGTRQQRKFYISECSFYVWWW